MHFVDAIFFQERYILKYKYISALLLKYKGIKKGIIAEFLEELMILKTDL